jgi:hypothetical protein
VLLFSCIANVIRNGVTAHDVGFTLEHEFGISLRNRLDAYLAWEERPSSRHLNENLMKECHNIIDKLSTLMRLSLRRLRKQKTLSLKNGRYYSFPSRLDGGVVENSLAYGYIEDTGKGPSLQAHADS